MVLLRALRGGGSRLRELALPQCALGNSGAAAVADYVQQSATLVELELQSNRIACRGAHALATALPSSKLVHINLNRNEIGRGGASALARAMRSAPSLATLNLLCNVVDNAHLTR